MEETPFFGDQAGYEKEGVGDEWHGLWRRRDPKSNDTYRYDFIAYYSLATMYNNVEAPLERSCSVPGRSWRQH